MGSGISDYLDPLFVASQKNEIVTCIRDELAASDDWDLCNWQDLAYDTPLRSLSDTFGVTKRSSAEKSHSGIPSTITGRNAHATCAATSGATETKRLTRATRLSSDLQRRRISVALADPSPWRAFESTGRAKHDRRRSLARISFRHRSTIRARQHATHFALRYEGQTAAVILAFVYDRVTYGYLTGFDPSFRQFSGASVLLAESLRECWRQGFRAWNFCRGDEPYKADWGAQAMRRCRLVLYPNRS